VEGHVVLAFDGSPDAERAVAWAVRIAHHLDHALTVVTARDLSRQWPAMTGGAEQWDQVAAERLARASTLVKEHGRPAPQLTATKQPPVETLRQLSRTAWLMVLGARGHTRIGGALIRSGSPTPAPHPPRRGATCR